MRTRMMSKVALLDNESADVDVELELPLSDEELRRCGGEKKERSSCGDERGDSSVAPRAYGGGGGTSCVRHRFFFFFFFFFVCFFLQMAASCRLSLGRFDWSFDAMSAGRSARVCV